MLHNYALTNLYGLEDIIQENKKPIDLGKVL